MGKNKHIDRKSSKNIKKPHNDVEPRQRQNTLNPKTHHAKTKRKSSEKSQTSVDPSLTIQTPTSFPFLNFNKYFWSGLEGESNPSEHLKELRKSYGINVKGNSLQLSPPPISDFNELMTNNPLSSEIMRILSHYSITQPSSIQRQAIPSILCGCDILGIAPTGSGKTLAYVLPMIPHILSQMKSSRNELKSNIKSKNLIALIIVPTRELCIQVEMVLKPLKKHLNIESCSIYGGQDKDTQISNYNKIIGGCHIVVCTPGRLLDCISTHQINLWYVTYVVLDEADRMLSLGFEEQLNTILKCIRSDRQTLLFSASFPGRLREIASSAWLKHDETVIRCNTIEVTVDPKHNDKQQTLQQLSSTDSTDIVPVKLQSTPSANSASTSVGTSADTSEAMTAVDKTLSSVAISATITQIVHVCASHKKPRLLMHFLEKVRTEEKAANVRQSSGILVFCTKILTIKFVHDFLKRQQENTKTIAMVGGFAMLHGGQLQQQREQTLDAFKAGKINILISTDVCARGLHVKRLKYVINYDFPGSIEQYAHRIGRVGRQGLSGEAYSLITRNMAPLVPSLVRLLKRYNQEVEPNLQALADDTEILADDDHDHGNEEGEGDNDEDNDDEEKDEEVAKEGDMLKKSNDQDDHDDNDNNAAMIDDEDQ